GKTFEITVAGLEVGFDGFKRVILDLGEQDQVWQMLNEAGYAPLPPYIFRDYSREEIESEPDLNGEANNTSNNGLHAEDSSKSAATAHVDREEDLRR
ncbi:hypothetical protein ABTK11_19725, partial [Acinetobacter baumannii]